jgi:hypothetical protein
MADLLFLVTEELVGHVEKARDRLLLRRRQGLRSRKVMAIKYGVPRIPHDPRWGDNY